MPLRGLGLGRAGAWPCAVGMPCPLGLVPVAWAWSRVLAKLCQFALGLCLGQCLRFGLLIVLRFGVDIAPLQACIIVCALCAYMFAVLLGAMFTVWGLGFGCALLWTLYPVRLPSLGCLVWTYRAKGLGLLGSGKAKALGCQ